ncbi:MAG: hypothetical protein IIB44_00410 [Candidatus Marinimicrobia bacterium]|nr:hypothetical protein [Candidatus Neomarinimicrobiota bacterium]
MRHELFRLRLKLGRVKTSLLYIGDIYPPLFALFFHEKIINLVAMFSKRIIFIIFLLPTLGQLEAENDISISSLIFFDATYSPESSSKTSSFNITRSYLNFRKTFFDNFHTRVTIDAGRTTDDQRQTFFLKYGYLDWNTPFGSFLLGMQPTNYFGPIIPTWGLRFIEKYPTDRIGFDPTSDVGISFKKQILSKWLVHVAIYNGGGYKKSENDSHKRTSFLLSYGEQKLNINPGWNGGIMFSHEPYDYNIKVASKNRFSLFGGIATNQLRIGLEFTKLNDNGLNHTQTFVSFYGNIFTKKSTSVFIRGDIFDPSTDEKNDKKSYFIVGFNYEPNPSVSISPNLRYTLYEPNNTASESLIKLNFQFKL